MGLSLRLVQENPPVVAVQWHSPRQTFGDVQGFQLSYGIQGEDSSTEERRFDNDKFRFTTGFLGQSRPRPRMPPGGTSEISDLVQSRQLENIGIFENGN